MRSTAAMPFSGKLSLDEALQRGLAYNLGAVGVTQTVRQNSAQVRVARSALLPNINGSLSETVEQTDLAAFGLHFSVPGYHIPTVVGPFNYFALQATLSQTVANLTALNNYRSAQATARASQYSLQDARDLVTLAVGGAYLQVLAAQARAGFRRKPSSTPPMPYSINPPNSTKKACWGGSTWTRARCGRSPSSSRSSPCATISPNRKSTWRASPGCRPMPTISSPIASPSARRRFKPWTTPLTRAEKQRADLKAAQSQVEAAAKALSAARAERLPSASVSGDYEAIGTNPANSHGAFTVVGTLNIPIWQGGRPAADIAQAQAVLAQRQAELEDTRGQIEAEIREAYLDLEAAAGQVEVARKNLQVAQETLEMTRARMEAGVINTVEVVQAQQTVASAQLDLINSVFAHNLAKLSLARDLGHATEQLPALLQPHTH